MRMWQLAAGYFSFFFSLHWLHLVPKSAQVDDELEKKTKQEKWEIVEKSMKVAWKRPNQKENNTEVERRFWHHNQRPAVAP